MNKTLYIALVLLLPVASHAQNGVVTYHVGSEYNAFAMSSLNDFMGKERSGFLETPTGTLSSGYGIYSSLRVGVSPSLRVGMFGKLLMGSSKQSGTLLVPNPVIPSVFDTLTLDYRYRASAVIIGVSPQLSLSHILKFAEKSTFVQRLVIDISLDIGMGVSFLERSEKLFYNDGTVALFTDNYQYRSKDFFAGLSVDAGYRLIASPLVSSIGVRLGYQRYRTQMMSNRTGENVFGTQERVSLDFSGLYIGGFISLGK